MSADVQKAENNTWCGYNYVQTSIFLSRGHFNGKKHNSVWPYTPLMYLCVSASPVWSYLSPFYPAMWRSTAADTMETGMKLGVFSLRTARQNSIYAQNQKQTEPQMMQNKSLNDCQPKQEKRKRRTFLRNSSATIRARALTDSFISLISLSISSIKWMTKSTNLCLYICSVWKLVIKKLIS